jgi:acetyl esterase/lipase
MDDQSGIDWEDAFANASHIENGDSYPRLWLERAAAFRAQLEGRVSEISYGAGAREKMDVFRPEGTPEGLLVFVHGGYWRAFDKDHWSHLSAGALARGWAVAMPGYTLAPDNSIAGITEQISHAITKAGGLVDGPIHLTGHSAGGHLVARMVSDDSTLPDPIAARIARVVSISGLHDLRPLMMNSLNKTLALTPESAAAESPALHRVRPGVRVTAWVGAAERPEFLRQAALLAESWPSADLIAAPDRHHFDVIEDLCEPASGLVSALLASE